MCMEGKEEGVTFRMVMVYSLCAWLYMPGAGAHPLYVGHLPQRLPHGAQLLTAGVRGILQRQECHQHRWL